ncbi:2269_t:CDS:2, partial [Funneliformis geosporum]
VNEDEMIWWVENVWSRRTVDSSNPSSLLVLDSFCGHLAQASNSITMSKSNI